MIAEDFNTILADQFDFHGYCLRKYTLRAYVKYVIPFSILPLSLAVMVARGCGTWTDVTALCRFLAMEDSIHQHTNYMRAALLASEVYLYLHEHPYSSSNADDDVCQKTWRT